MTTNEIEQNIKECGCSHVEATAIRALYQQHEEATGLWSLIEQQSRVQARLKADDLDAAIKEVDRKYQAEEGRLAEAGEEARQKMNQTYIAMAGIWNKAQDRKDKNKRGRVRK